MFVGVYFFRNYMDITSKLSSKVVKPPNVLIFADSTIALNNVKSVLDESLGTDKYVHFLYCTFNKTCGYFKTPNFIFIT